MSEIVKRAEEMCKHPRMNFNYADGPKLVMEMVAEIQRLTTALENARKENAELKSTVVAFAGPHAVEVAKFHGLPKNHLLSNHYDLLAKCGGRMVDFVRSEEHS